MITTSALTGFKRTDQVIQLERSRAADGRHLKRHCRRNGERIEPDTLVQERCRLNFCEQVEGVVARRAIGPETHKNAGPQHVGDRSNTTGEL